MQAQPRHIAVLMPTDSQYTRGLLDGICAYAHPMHHWHFRLGTATEDSRAMVRRMRPDGIITMAPDEAFARSLMKLGIPLVNCSSNASIPGLPVARIDNEAIGRMAAGYFQQRLFEHFAFCGRPGYSHLMARCHAFEQVITAAGLPCYRFLKWPDLKSWLTARTASELRRWLTRLPKPLAVFSSDDLIAIQAVAACDTAGLKVPEDVAVLGVDNDELICRLASPSISSVALPHTEIGYHAAALLDRLINERPSSSASPPVMDLERILPPTEIVTRASTDIVAVTDSQVAAALRYIREHGERVITVPDVVEATAVSRRVLEARFRRTLGRTIFSEIRRTHLHHACRLLRETNWTIDRVVREAGFSSRARLEVAFRQHIGQTPGGYRKQFIRRAGN